MRTSTARVILFGMILVTIPTTAPIVDPPTTYDDTPLIHTETPTIPPIAPTIPHTSSFWSLTTLVLIAIPVPEALSPVRANLLPPRKRIRGSVFTTDNEVSSEERYEPYTEPDTDSDVQADIDACIAVADGATARETNVGDEVGTHTEDEAKDEAESRDGDTVEIGVDRVTQPIVSDNDLESREVVQTVLGQSAAMSKRIGVLEGDNVKLRGMLCVAREQIDRLRRRMAYSKRDLRQICHFRYYDRMRAMPTTRSGITQESANELIAKRVAEALEAYDVAKNPKAEEEMEDEQEVDNRDDNENNNGNGGNKDGNPNVNVRRVVTPTRECTYQDFLKCQPLNFKGTEGVVGLTRWFEKMETVFHISNYPQKYQVKYALCTLQNGALTWWNSHKRAVGVDDAYAMRWKELILLYTKMVPKEEDRVDKFIGGLLDNIQGNVITAEPTRLQDSIRIANNLMDQKLKGYAARNAENKRRFDSNPQDNCVPQPPFKSNNIGGQNVTRAYTIGNDYGFVRYTFDYRVTLGFGNVAGGLDHISVARSELPKKVYTFYTGLDIPTRKMIDSKEFIPLMTPIQALKSIQVTVDHSHDWYNEATTRERINDSPDNEKAYQLTQTVLTNTREKVKARTTMGKENMKEPVPRNLPPKPFIGHLKEQIGSPYKTRETICMIGNPEEIHKVKAQEDEGDMDIDWDITIKDVERLKQFLTPTIHTLPNLEPVMPLGPVHDKEKIKREE
ncbi:hypothetical protein Tco_0226881 [Tanacetum coccineum]